MTLSVRDGYRAWAATFDAETPVSLLDDMAVRAWHVTGAWPLLDVGCGTGRRLPAGPSAGAVVGVDLSREMLRAGKAVNRRHLAAAADARHLPFCAATFACIWCRLVIGHVPDPATVYHELARVIVRGGTVVVTDFHPAASAAGHSRSFRDATGMRHAIEHYPHALDDHRRAAGAAGLTLLDTANLAVGPAVRDAYKGADRLDWYARDLGLPLVLALRFVR